MGETETTTAHSEAQAMLDTFASVSVTRFDVTRTTRAGDQLPRVAPAVFLILETSPGNFQAWLALAGREDKEFVRRVRRGTGADATASGATRVAGSLNFKDKYAPDFPRVAIRDRRAGRMATSG